MRCRTRFGEVAYNVEAKALKPTSEDRSCPVCTWPSVPDHRPEQKARRGRLESVTVNLCITACVGFAAGALVKLRVLRGAGRETSADRADRTDWLDPSRGRRSAPC